MWRWLANALLAVLACTRWRDRAEMVGESIACMSLRAGARRRGSIAQIADPMGGSSIM